MNLHKLTERKERFNVVRILANIGMLVLSCLCWNKLIWPTWIAYWKFFNICRWISLALLVVTVLSIKRQPQRKPWARAELIVAVVNTMSWFLLHFTAIF